MLVQVLSIFPQLVESYCGAALLGRAQRRRVLEIEVFDIRSFADPPHYKVDDRPYGGGPGMVMACEPIDRAMEAAEASWRRRYGGESRGHGLQSGAAQGEGASLSSARGRRIFLSPQGPVLDQDRVRDLAVEERLVMLCGRYEGVDQRVLAAWEFEEISIGNYVLAGGELPALVAIEAVCRWLPGALGQPDSVRRDALSRGLVGFAQYTRPADWNGRPVPPVLLQGDHGTVSGWRRSTAEQRTQPTTGSQT